MFLFSYEAKHNCLQLLSSASPFDKSDKSRKLAKLQLTFYHERNRKEVKLYELRYYSTQG